MIRPGQVDLALGDVHLEGRHRQLADLGQGPDGCQKSTMGFVDLAMLGLGRPEQVSRWRDTLAEARMTNSTILRKLTTLRSLFSYLQTYGYTGANSAHGKLGTSQQRYVKIRGAGQAPVASTPTSPCTRSE